MMDANDIEDDGRYSYQPSKPKQPGDPGFRLGVWTNDYNPGDNWNNGQAPQGAVDWNMDSNNWDVPKKKETSVDTRAPQPPVDPAPRGPQVQFQPPAAVGGGDPGPAPAAAPQASYKTNPITDEVTRILMAKLKDLQNPGDLAGDPNYQNAVRAYQVESLRGADRQRKALAERAAAGGTRASGGFNVGVRGIEERAGENAAKYTSGLAMDRLQERERQLSQYISMARAVGQDDIANQLEIQRLQLQSELGRGDLALRGELGRGQLGLGRDQLGFNYADLITRANRDATLAALNG